MFLPVDGRIRIRTIYLRIRIQEAKTYGSESGTLLFSVKIAHTKVDVL
jgi:hypothetical protein